MDGEGTGLRSMSLLPNIIIPPLAQIFTLHHEAIHPISSVRLIDVVRSTSSGSRPLSVRLG